jgi:hypothetical protein
MPLQKHEVQSFNHTSPSASDIHSSSDELAKNVGTDNLTKSEKSDCDPVYRDSTNKKAHQTPQGIVQLIKSLVLPIVGEDVHFGMTVRFC